MYQFCIFNVIILVIVKCIKGNNFLIIFNLGRVIFFDNNQISYFEGVCYVFFNGFVNGFFVFFKVKVFFGFYRFYDFILCILKVYLEKKMVKYFLKNYIELFM